MNLSFVKVALNLLTITTEVVLYESALQHRYWKKTGEEQYVFEPSEAESEWQAKFLKL
jgi:hypothetical protein